MPNQRAIAAAAGLTQATVSKALRGDRSIPEPTRQHIEKIAHDLGYRPNAYVSTLMAHIRSGKPLCDKGCIALLVDAASEKDWLGHGNDSYVMQYLGVRNRAQALGFATECFYLRSPSGSAACIDRILRARGIHGVILMPRHMNSPEWLDSFALAWEHYAAVTIAYTWRGISIDRVSSHHRHNMERAFTEVLRRGYTRIGMCLPPEAIEGVDYSWRERYLLCRDRLPQKGRIPLFVGKPGLTPLEKFRAWLDKWKPDVLLGLIGHEKEWLDKLGLSIPKDIGMACINRPPGSDFSGVEENLEIVGAAAMDAVSLQIQCNEYGLPSHPKLILIDGTWTEGKTLASL